MIRTTWMGLAVAAMLATGLAVAGCGGNGSTGGGGSGGGGDTTSAGSGSSAAACTDFTAAVCDKLNTCAPFLVSAEYGDAAGCKARQGLNCASIVKLPGVKATAADFTACTSAYASESCADLFGGTIPAACTAVSNGSEADGTVCAQSLQCVSGDCVVDTATGCGVCAHLGATGDACDPMAANNCGPGTFCSAMAMKCTAVTGAKGAMCSATAPCSSAFICTAGVCADPLAAGAACDPMAPGCDGLKGLYCGSMSKTCDTIKLSAGGGPCGFDTMTGVITACSGGGHCVTSGATGTCSTPIADGAACTLDPMKGDPCLSPAHCVNSVCSLEAPTCK